jgi:hypothetical protein
MLAALGDALAFAELPALDKAESAPFSLRRRLAKEAMERLDYQIAYLKEWHEHLSDSQKGVRMKLKPLKKEVKFPSGYLARERRVS